MSRQPSSVRICPVVVLWDFDSIRAHWTKIRLILERVRLHTRHEALQLGAQYQEFYQVFCDVRQADSLSLAEFDSREETELIEVIHVTAEQKIRAIKKKMLKFHTSFRDTRGVIALISNDTCYGSPLGPMCRQLGWRLVRASTSSASDDTLKPQGYLATSVHLDLSDLALPHNEDQQTAANANFVVHLMFPPAVLGELTSALLSVLNSLAGTQLLHFNVADGRVLLAARHATQDEARYAVAMALRNEPLCFGEGDCLLEVYSRPAPDLNNGFVETPMPPVMPRQLPRPNFPPFNACPVLPTPIDFHMAAEWQRFWENFVLSPPNQRYQSMLQLAELCRTGSLVGHPPPVFHSPIMARPPSLLAFNVPHILDQNTTAQAPYQNSAALDTSRPNPQLSQDPIIRDMTDDLKDDSSASSDDSAFFRAGHEFFGVLPDEGTESLGGLEHDGGVEVASTDLATSTCQAPYAATVQRAGVTSSVASELTAIGPVADDCVQAPAMNQKKRRTKARDKFVKPSPQCYHWEMPEHRSGQTDCIYWHPKQPCRFYPNCASEARDCGFAHPFCGRECKCSMTERDPQKNHRPKKIAKK